VSEAIKRIHGYLAEFDSPQALYEAAKKANEAGFTHWDVHSPYPIHGMDDAMGLGRSKLPHLVFFGGVAGFCTAFFLASATQTNVWGKLFTWLPGGMPYPTVVQAKPDNIFTTPAFFPVMFELTILLSAFTILIGLLSFIQLPRLNHPLFESDRFRKVTDDAFFMCIESKDPQFSEAATREFLEEIGGANIELVEEEI
jgi:hypothetical protein